MRVVCEIEVKNDEEYKGKVFIESTANELEGCNFITLTAGDLVLELSACELKAAIVRCASTLKAG